MILTVWKSLTCLSQGSPQGSPQGSLGNLRISSIFLIFYVFFWFFGKILRLLVKMTWFLSFSGKNDAESFRNFIKIPFLNPKRAKLVQKSYGKFTESLRNLPRPYVIFQDLSRRTHKGPYGPIYGPQPGPSPQPGLGPNPARAAQEGPYGPIKIS